MKAIVDLDACIGCGLCPETCPNVFEMGDDDKAHVKADPIPAGDEALAQDAADECPVSAIEISG